MRKTLMGIALFLLVYGFLRDSSGAIAVGAFLASFVAPLLWFSR